MSDLTTRIRRIIVGACRSHNDAHPDYPIPPKAIGSIAKRAARQIRAEVLAGAGKSEPEGSGR